MAYTPTVWANETPGSSPILYTIKDAAGNVVHDNVQIEIKTAVTAGTPVNAANMNKIEAGIVAAEAAAAQAASDAEAAADAATAAAAAASADAAAAALAAEHVIGIAQRTSEIYTTSTAFVDVTSMMVSINAPGPGKILVIASGTMRAAGAGHEAHVRATIDGDGDPSSSFVSAYDSGDVGWRPFGYTWLQTGITAGAKTVSLQYRTTNSAARAYIAKATLIAIWFSD